MVLSNKAYSLRVVQVFAPFLLLLSLSSCHLEVLDPIRNGLIADFDYAFSNQEGDVPINVSFVNGSTEAISYRWDFGDGSVLSTEFNPSHDYTKAGDYTVTLTAVNELGEEDFISIPVTLTSRKFVKEWPLQGNAGYVFTGFAPFSDTAYLFSGYGFGSIYPDGSILTDLYGDTLFTPFYFSPDVTGDLIASIPGYNLDFVFANTISYDANGTVHTGSVDFDLILLWQYDDFGYPAHVVYKTEGIGGGASNIYFGSEGSADINPVSPKLMNFFGEGFTTLWPLTLNQFCTLSGLTISPDDGVVGIGFQSTNCDEGLRIEAYDPQGNQLNFRNLNIPSGSEGWKIVLGNPGQYVAIGNYPDERQLVVYIMDEGFNILSQNTIGTEQDLFELKDAKSGNDGAFFVVGISSTGSVTAFKINNDGSSVWQQAYDFPNKFAAVNGIYPTNDCGLLIYGSYSAGFNPDAPLIIKTDQDGLVE